LRKETQQEEFYGPIKENQNKKELHIITDVPLWKYLRNKVSARKTKSDVKNATNEPLLKIYDEVDFTLEPNYSKKHSFKSVRSNSIIIHNNSQSIAYDEEMQTSKKMSLAKEERS